MADAITIKALQDASLDAKSLEEVVNGDEAKQVTTRKGETYPSVKKAIKTLFENGGLPATPFATKALMEASELTDGAYAVVSDDTEYANIGLYVKDGGIWVKSSYTPLLKNDDSSGDYIKGVLSENVIDKDNFIQSINLYSPNEVTVGYSIDPDGLPYERDNFQITDFIAASPNSAYTVSQRISIRFFISVAVLYNREKEQVGRVSLPASLRESGYYTFNTTHDTAYIRLSCQDIGDTDQNRMLYKGDDQIPYERFQPRKLDYRFIEFGGFLNQFAAKNEIDDLVKKSDVLFEGSYNLYDPKAVSVGFSLYPFGELNANERFQVSDFIPVEGGEIYTASQYGYLRRYISSVVFYDEDKLQLIKVETRELGTETEQVSMVAPENAAFARLSCEFIGDSDVTKQRMFYKGDIGKEYVPYSRKIKHEYIPDGDFLHFTGDKHTPAVLNFTDSYSKDDERNISTENEPVTYEDMLTWWGDLADEFPDYITKEFVGYDSSGVLEVHSYHFNPPMITNSDLINDNTERPRVMIIAFHIEQMNQLYPYLAMREICRSWRDSPALAALRFEVEFMVIPYAHPYGFGNDYRLTSEGLNTNGDFPFLWNKVGGSAPNGDTPFATQEMRNVKKVAERFKPHVFLDLHSNFAGALGSGLWASVGEYGGYKSVVTRAVTSLYPEVVKADEQAPTLDKIARFTYNSRARVAAGYAYMLGTTGGLIEIAKNYKNRPPEDGLYNDGLIFGSSMLLSLVTQCIAEYRDNGNPFDEGKYGTYDEILAKYGLSRDE